MPTRLLLVFFCPPPWNITKTRLDLKIVRGKVKQVGKDSVEPYRSGLEEDLKASA
jgi:hypothetical protein